MQTPEVALVVPPGPWVPAPYIDRRAFEELVDSSLRLADKVDTDEQSLKGELWLLRGCRWWYRPYRFRLAYHVFHGELSIVYFQFQRVGALGRSPWRAVKTTDDYRKILKAADVARRAAP